MIFFYKERCMPWMPWLKVSRQNPPLNIQEKKRTHDQFLPFWPWSLHHQHPQFDQCPCRLCCPDASLKMSTVVCFVCELCHPNCCNKNLRHRLLCIAYACRNFESTIVSMPRNAIAVKWSSNSRTNLSNEEIRNKAAKNVCGVFF